MRRKTLNGVLWQGCYPWKKVDITPSNPPFFPQSDENGCKPEVCFPTGPSRPTVPWFTDPTGETDLFRHIGRPPNVLLNMLTGRNRRGGNHARSIQPQTCCVCSVRLPFFLKPGNQKYPKSRKWLQLTIMLITMAQNKSQAEKSLDGNCYNCPNNGKEYFSLLNYMWLNI